MNMKCYQCAPALRAWQSISSLEKILTWVKEEDNPNQLFQREYFFRAEPLAINADIQLIANLIMDVQQYHLLSDGAISANIAGVLQPEKIITLKLFKNKLIGKFIPKVHATVTMVEKFNHHFIIGWSVELPRILGGGKTERYQVLEKLTEQMTRSYIVDRIPGFIGLLTNLIISKLIKDAFNSLNAGIKRNVEKSRYEKVLFD